MAQGPMNSVLVTIWITVRIRESVPDHDPDPGRTATLSTHTEQMPCKNHSAIILLCWRPGGGLCSLSTSSLKVFFAKVQAIQAE